MSTYPTPENLRAMQINPATFPTEQECARLGLDPDLLTRAWHIDTRWGELSEWAEQLDDDQQTAGHRVVTYCLLETDQFEDCYGTPAAA